MGWTRAGAAFRLQMGAFDGTPAPLKMTLWGLPVASLVTLATPTLPAVVDGVKVTLRLQETPAARLAPQSALTAKSPVVSMLEMASAPVPVFVSVTLCGALVVPTFCSPKTNAPGVNDTPGKGVV